MRVFRAPDAPPSAANPASFTGTVTVATLASDETGAPVHVYRVHFSDGGRTYWHSHTGPQWLLVIAGRIRLQRWGETAVDLEAGDAAVIHAGEKHWHGARPGGTGLHLAVNVNATTAWLEAVTEADYRSGHPVP